MPGGPHSPSGSYATERRLPLCMSKAAALDRAVPVAVRKLIWSMSPDVSAGANDS
jgi:hypothetical protein